MKNASESIQCVGGRVTQPATRFDLTGLNSEKMNSKFLMTAKNPPRVGLLLMGKMSDFGANALGLCQCAK